MAVPASESLRVRSEPVPFVDLAPQHRPLAGGILDDVAGLLETGAFIGGEAVERFEHEFADYVGVRHCIGVASGLDALRLAFLAAGLQPGEGVVVPAATFAATFEAVEQAGGRPVVVDVSDADYGLDPRLLAEALSPDVRFVLPVHLYGQMADVSALQAVCRQRDAVMIEDACQAHGACRDDLRAGAVGSAAAFSFYPAKNLGAMGDAGAAVTNDDALAAHIRVVREHGQTAKYRHEYSGYTARLDALQALVLARKLRRLDSWNEQRRRAAAYYMAALEGIGDVRLPPVAIGSEPVWHLFVIRTGDPDALAHSLAADGVQTARHYPQPPHLSPAYAHLGLPAGSFPIAEALSREGLSLPMFPGMTESQLARVCAAVAEFFARG
jgi:dTDP-4-amino-4,6-dideoxygalactose transaminase